MLMEVSAETVVMEPDPSPVRCHLWQVRYFQFLAELGPLTSGYKAHSPQATVQGWPAHLHHRGQQQFYSEDVQATLCLY